MTTDNQENSSAVEPAGRKRPKMVRHAREKLTRYEKRLRKTEKRAPRIWKATLVGVALFAMLTPVILPAYYGVTTVTNYWEQTPTDLPQPPMPEPSVILAADGTTLANVYLYNRDTVTFEEISPLVRQALVAVEDVRFYDHYGVDFKGIARAIKIMFDQQGAASQGGSSITQQYVKMTLEAVGLAREDEQLKSAATEDSVWRKMREAKQALHVEEQLTKDEILTNYLNLAYFGAGAYGIQAAAQRYYSTNASDVTLAQAALLVGLVNNPSTLDPTKNPEGAKKRRDLVLRRMHTAGFITAQERDDATATDVDLEEKPVANGCARGPAPLFCDWVREELEHLPALGNTVEERRARLLEGGLTITTTLDLKTQKQVEDAMLEFVPADHEKVAAQALVEPGTGNVRALASTRPYGQGEGESVISFPTVESFQPGSTFKVFTLLAALEQGMPTDTVLPGGPRHESKVFKNPKAGYFTNAGDGAGRNVTLAQATTSSVNTAFVQLQERVGTQAVVDVAARAGNTSIKKYNIADSEGSLTLGARETSVLQMANSYATVAAHGKACQPRGVEKIVTKSGEELPTDPRCEQVFSPAVADTAAALLHDVVENGTGTGAKVKGHEIAGKTGTTQGFGAAWFAGFTPHYASAVWIGDPRGQTHALEGHMFKGKPRHVYGGTIPADIFRQTFTAVLKDQKPQPLARENLTYLAGAN